MTAPSSQRQMTYQEYVEAHAAILAALAALLLPILVPFQALRLTRRDWLGILAIMYPVVESARYESGELARRFYDSERSRFFSPIESPALRADIFGPDGRPIQVTDPTGLVRRSPDRIPIFIPDYSPDWFEEAMEAIREEFSRDQATDGALAEVISIAGKQVENGGRRTNLRAVDKDPKVLGWARVQGGEDSCSFCAMLISRGPVYKFADTAGLDADDVSAVEIFKQAESSGDNSFIDELMTRWHPNCDCKVVPVFDRADWPGIDQYKLAEKLWADSTAGFTGKDKLNAFRRAYESGNGELVELPAAA